MDLKWWIDAVGWVGSVEVVVAYALISTKKLDGESFWYQMLNLTGAIFLIVNTYYYHAYPSTFINVVWLFIAVIALSKMFFGKRNNPKPG